MEEHLQPVIKRRIIRLKTSSETQGILNDMENINAEIALPLIFPKYREILPI